MYLDPTVHELDARPLSRDDALGFSLKPPKWLRKAQPGKLLQRALPTAAKYGLPIVGTAAALSIPGVAPFVGRALLGVGRGALAAGRGIASGAFATGRGAVTAGTAIARELLTHGGNPAAGEDPTRRYSNFPPDETVPYEMPADFGVPVQASGRSYARRAPTMYEGPPPPAPAFNPLWLGAGALALVLVLGSRRR